MGRAYVTGRTVLVVGDVIDDVVVRPRRPTSPDSDTPARIAACPGGSGANQAAWLGALGADVRFAGRVAAADADRHTAALRAHGVDARLSEDPDAPTGRIVIIAADGRRDMYTDRGANLNLTAADLPDDLLDGVALLHLSGYSLFDPSVRSAVLDLRARAPGVRLSVDPASAAFLADVGPDRFRTWTAGAHLVFPNLAEARLLTGTNTAEEAATALTETYGTAAVTLGPHGALVATPDGTRVRLPAAPAPVVDPTGAGDAFTAGFLTAHLTGAGLEACTRTALAAASRAVASPGARPAETPA